MNEFSQFVKSIGKHNCAGISQQLKTAVSWVPTSVLGLGGALATE